jgi:hypothetical protein
MKTSLFVKMCKDVQISSRRFTGTQIELELAKILRQLRGTEVRVGGTFISFVEFLAVLEGIAPSVYPNCPVDVACRRLLLENVLLLAGRRNESANFDLDNEEVVYTCTLVHVPTHAPTLTPHSHTHAHTRTHIHTHTQAAKFLEGPMTRALGEIFKVLCKHFRQPPSHS